MNLMRALRATSTRSRIGFSAAAVAGGTAFYGADAAQSLQSIDTKTTPIDLVSAAVYGALINRKVNACPMAVRVAWVRAQWFTTTTHLAPDAWLSLPFV